MLITKLCMEKKISKLFRILNIYFQSYLRFDTSFGGFVFSEQFLQISTFLKSNYIFGFGENNHETFRHDFFYKSWGMFARDNAPGWGVSNFFII